jgi:WD40 repeat protein
MIEKGETFQALCPLVESGSLIAWAAGKHLVVYCKKSEKFQIELNDQLASHTDAIRSIAFNSEANRIASVGEDKRVLIWERKPDESNQWSIASSYMHSKKIMVVHFDGAGNVLFGDKFGEFFQVGSDSDKPKLLFGHLSAVSASLFSLKRGLLISADRDEKIRVAKYPQVWEISSFLFGHRKYVSSLCWFGEDENRLVSAGADGQIILWDVTDVSSPVRIWTISLEEGPINSICVWGGIVFVLRTDNANKVVRIENGVLCGTIDLPEEAQGILASKKDGSILAVDNNSHLWEVNRGLKIPISKDIKGIPISLMKIVHHENVDDEEDCNNRKKRK